MDWVCDDHEPLIIMRNGQQSVVMISLDGFKALEKAACLRQAPRNARQLREAVVRLETGQGQER